MLFADLISSKSLYGVHCKLFSASVAA